ncbi:MAG: dTDP-rhamnosyl transferase RfbF [Rhodanobacteraceae bacterium]|jgi:rhamnosyltransferase|nr:MAG: dTDP-rhamnosyl transferase RfbF [Rhodanobacteraceae bacterium]
MSEPSAAPARAAGVCAVVVTYHPDATLLAAQLDALQAQADRIVVVDNATPGDSVRALCAPHPQVELLSLTENLGLAAALNAGITRARETPGMTHVLLMDQDSVPEPGMVAALKAALDRQSQRTRVAAVGTRFLDPREGVDAPFVRIRFPVNLQLRCSGECDEIPCDFLITSGSLIPLDVLDQVGGMDEALFIDNVDLEWCFRATSKGYALFGVCGARMLHHHGAARHRLPGVPRGVVVHTPRRLFYMMRNRVLLYRRAYTPRRWIAQDVPRLVVKFLLFALLIAPRRENVRGMLAGLRAGVAGRTAPPPPDIG